MGQRQAESSGPGRQIGGHRQSERERGHRQSERGGPGSQRGEPRQADEGP